MNALGVLGFIMSSRGRLSYRIQTRLLYFIIPAYFAFAVVGTLFMWGVRGELFPVFNWNLYSRVESRCVEYRIEILRIGDVSYSPPAKFMPLANAGGKGGVTAALLVQDLGKEFSRNGRSNKFIDLKNSLERLCFTPGEEYLYRLTRVEYSPLAQYQGDANRDIERKILSDFRRGDP